jgi:hypothetical protein
MREAVFDEAQGMSSEAAHQGRCDRGASTGQAPPAAARKDRAGRSQVFPPVASGNSP